jgi:hypothetical protein
MFGKPPDFRLKPMGKGSHPPPARCHQQRDNNGRVTAICPCRVPDVIIAAAWANLWFQGDTAEPWVMNMIRIADASMLE